jgi:hypothetical protein
MANFDKRVKANKTAVSRPWDDPADIVVCTTQDFLDGKLPIILVIRDEGAGRGLAGWQFLDGQPLEGREPAGVAKPDLLILDPTLVEVTDLPIGWYAEREGPGGPWKRGPLAEKSEKEPVDNELSPEADQFLAEACQEYEAKQATLDRDWKFDSAQEWWFEQDTGVLELKFADGSRLEATAQILGSYSEEDNTWEWSWNNPCADDHMAEHSRMVKQLGKRLGLEYLEESPIPIPVEAVDRGHLAYLCGIALKATGAPGVFEGRLEGLRIFYTLTCLRWANK